MSNVFSGVCTCGSDAVVRHLPSGQMVLSVNCANNIGFGDKQKTIWLRVSLFGKRAEGELKNYLRKGQQLFVSGELTMSEYTANDGNKRTQLELNANTLDLVGKREELAPITYNRPPPVVLQTPTAGQYKYDAPPSTNSGLKYPENGAPYEDDDIPF